MALPAPGRFRSFRERVDARRAPLRDPRRPHRACRNLRRRPPPPRRIGQSRQARALSLQRAQSGAASLRPLGCFDDGAGIADAPPHRHPPHRPAAWRCGRKPRGDEAGLRDSPSADAYLWYYASQVLVQTGGPEWDAWYGQLCTALEAEQVTDGENAGSWEPLGTVPDRWGAFGGRLYVTALHLLALEVPYRHLPTYGATDNEPR